MKNTQMTAGKTATESVGVTETQNKIYLVDLAIKVDGVYTEYELKSYIEKAIKENMLVSVAEVTKVEEVKN